MRSEMAYDNATAERVRRILAARPGVVEKRMVGGLSFNMNGVMCCGVTGTALIVRVGHEARAQALAEPHVRPREFAGRPLAAFICVDPEGFRTESALATWVQRGVDFASTLAANSPAAGRPAPKKRGAAGR
jgi:TfoX/Sxy family transcriptional regulator of competence genes